MSMPTAAELRAEREAAKNAAAERAHTAGMREAERLIRHAHDQGRDSVSMQPPPDSVVEVLRANGYKVSGRQPGCGLGGVDTIDISWR